MKFFGKRRTNTNGVPKNHFRLKKIANKNDIQIKVDKHLDLVEDDVLVLAGTGYSNRESEKVTVKTYDPTTGIVELKSAIQFYHWGKDTNVNNFGIDIRGEVAVLNRNIQIIGDLSESDWGCQVLTGSFLYFSPTFIPIQKIG